MLGSFHHERLYIAGWYRVADPTWIRQCSLFGALYKNRIHDSEHFAGLRLPQRAPAIARIGDRVQLKDPVGVRCLADCSNVKLGDGRHGGIDRNNRGKTGPMGRGIQAENRSNRVPGEIELLAFTCRCFIAQG